MAFGPIMRFQVGDLTIELAPLTRESMVKFVQLGLQLQSIFQYLNRGHALVEEDEYEFYDHTRKKKDSLLWGIWVILGEQRELIGCTELMSINTTKGRILEAESGSLIFNKDYWGKGIASAAHKARTWYAFQYLGLHRITSCVIQGNEGSLKALSRSGYTLVYVERNGSFVNGEIRHHNHLECLNPNNSFWTQWWNGDRPAKASIEARRQTRAILDWAKQNVKLL